MLDLFTTYKNILDRSSLRGTRKGIKYIIARFPTGMSEALFHQDWQPPGLAFPPLLLKKLPKILNTSLGVDLIFVFVLLIILTLIIII